MFNHLSHTKLFLTIFMTLLVWCYFRTSYKPSTKKGQHYFFPRDVWTCSRQWLKQPSLFHMSDQSEPQLFVRPWALWRKLKHKSFQNFSQPLTRAKRWFYIIFYINACMIMILIANIIKWLASLGINMQYKLRWH